MERRTKKESVGIKAILSEAPTTHCFVRLGKGVACNTSPPHLPIYKYPFPLEKLHNKIGIKIPKILSSLFSLSLSLRNLSSLSFFLFFLRKPISNHKLQPLFPPFPYLQSTQASLVSYVIKIGQLCLKLYHFISFFPCKYIIIYMKCSPFLYCSFILLFFTCCSICLYLLFILII